MICFLKNILVSLFKFFSELTLDLCLTQWVKDLVLPALQCRLQMWLRSGVAVTVA